MKKNPGEGLFSGVQLILSVVWKSNKKYYIYVCIDLVRLALSPFIMVIFPKLVLDSLGARNFKAAIIYIIYMTSFTLLNTIAVGLINAKKR